MKITILQTHAHIGNIHKNTTYIIEQLKTPICQNADLIILPELSITGYHPEDVLLFNHFIEESNKAIAEIEQTIKQTQNKDWGILIGAPHAENGQLYNAAFFISKQKKTQIFTKQLLPNYDVFNEKRHFFTRPQDNFIEFNKHKIALTICEDLWAEQNEYQKLYQQNPLANITKKYGQLDLIINMSASPFSYTKLEDRKNLLKNTSKKYNCPIIYVNQVASNSSELFDGKSLIYNKNGEQIAQLKAFKSDYFEFDNQKNYPIIANKTNHKYEQIEDALIFGIQEYFQKNNFSKAILGLSGGIDSALVYYLATKALGSENVLAVLMPSKYSSDHSLTDAKNLVNNLNGKYKIISIENIINTFEQNYADAFNKNLTGLAAENVQARVRGNLLMGIANQENYILLNTSNKSELAVGYGTLYGDLCGALSVIGDLYKTEVYEFCEYINNIKLIIPTNILTKSPSAELRPNQKDSDSLPDYNILDNILKYYIEEKKSKKTIINLGFEEKIVNKSIELVQQSEYKRKQLCPILKISNFAFGKSWQIPILSKK